MLSETPRRGPEAPLDDAVGQLVERVGDVCDALGAALQTQDVPGPFASRLTGAFEATTEAGVRAFQSAEALPVDGKVGPLTKIRLYERLPGYATPPSIAALPAAEPATPRGGTS